MISALDRKLLRDLWHLRGQVLAIAAVIMGGVATLVMSMSTFGSLDGTRERFYRDHRFAEVFARLERAPEAAAARLREVEGIDRVETRVVAHVRLEVAGFHDPITGLLVSLPDGGEPVLNALYLRRGRLPGAFRSDEAVLAETFADAHGLNPGDEFAAIIDGRRKVLRVVGVAISPEFVYQIAPGAMFPDFRRYGVVWMGREALANAYDMDGAFNDVTATIARDASERAVIDRLDAVLGQWGGTGAFPRADQFSNRFISEEMKQLKTMATIFPAIFLGIAAFLLNIVVSRLIALQRDQVAILKAFGYPDAAIGWHYVKFVMAIVLIGVAAGTALGAWFGHGLSTVYRETTFRFPYLDYRVDAWLVWVSLVVSSVAAVGGSLFAVFRAARLPPAEAMRPEAPAQYRATLLERIGLQRAFAAPTRMILRHIERRPLKALLATLGISCACALMMVGNYQKDAIDFIVDLQFRHAGREDLALGFVRPTSGKALHELRALPGVWEVEGFRDAPAILRFENRHFRTSVYGIAPAGRLHRSLDRDLQPVHVPGGGLVLTDYLADVVLQVKPGQSLTVEFLDGRRKVVEVPVLGITSQYLGVSAYMQQESLNALLQEGDVVTGAYTSLQPGAEAAVYAALHTRPRVLGLVANDAAIRSFYDTIGQFILFYNLVATVLAGAVGFGVVYNSARVALSEGGRELASLRVLGFTRGEIAYILLGELGLLALLAIPLGFLVGVGLISVLVSAFVSELYRLPLVLAPGNFAMGAAVVVGAALLSGLLIWRRLGQLDLVGVLKTRE